MDKVAIIGTGLIGTSLGLAMKRTSRKNVQIVGTDMERRHANKAHHMGAVDRVVGNLAGAAEDAQVVIIATPVKAMKDVMEIISPRLMEGCVVTDTGASKGIVLEWAEQYLPQSVSFVGGHPMVSKEASGPGAANGSLFQDIPYCIIPGRRARQDAVRLLTEMIGSIGGKPFFMDVSEHDSFVSGVCHLPVLLSVALLGCTSKSSSWHDIAKIASAQYREVTSLASGNAVTSADICFGDNQDIVYWIDAFIHELYEIRRILEDDADGKGEALEKVFDQAVEARERWLAGLVRPPTQATDNTQRIPSTMDTMGTLLMGDSQARRRVFGRGDRREGDRDPRKRK